MPEDKFVIEIMTSWLTIELVRRGYPVNTGCDITSLLFAVEQGEIIVVTRDINRIAILIHAVKSFILRFAKCQNDMIQSAVKLADDLQTAAQDTLAEIRGESYLEILPN